jgi:DNA-directed RNA polymerase specialized sigma24 family protein
VQAAIDNVTFEEWWGELAPAVRAFMLKKRCPLHLVDDIVQETGLRLFKMWDDIDAMRSPRGLAYTIASNLLWDERNRRSAREVVGDVPEQACEDVERSGIARLELARVKRALVRLNPQQRAVLLAEIGDATGPNGSPDAVKMMRMRARKKLHALLDTAPAGIFAFFKLRKGWFKTLRSAQRSTVLQAPAIALVATCTTIAIVGLPPSQRVTTPSIGIATARPTTAHAAASAALTGFAENRAQATSPRSITRSSSGSGTVQTGDRITVDVPEGTPVHGGADVSVTPAEGFVFEPPSCDADPNGTTVHVRCQTQLGDKRVEADTVLGIDP